MKTIFQKRKAALAESTKANVETIPDYKVRTPLQRAVQILKWHRDVYFKNNDNKPISIIITTLAAQNYQNEADIFDAITNIVNIISDVNRLKGAGSSYYIPNPVNPDENFADRWNENPARPLAFFTWVEQLKADFSTALSQKDMYKIAESLSPAFGANIIERSLEKYGSTVKMPTKTYPEVTFSTKPNKPWANIAWM
jgi:hypothetical protein